MQITPSTCWRYAARQRDPALCSAHARRDDFQVYGADKVWLWRQLLREGVPVARRTVERRMRCLELRGAIRGKGVRTTVGDAGAVRAPDRANRQFKADRPNQLWVSDFTYVSTWQGCKGDSYDNALAETVNGLYKTEPIHRRALEIHRGRRIGYPRMDHLVQPPAAP